MGSHNRDLPVTGTGLDDGAQGTEDIFLLKTLHQGALVLIRHEIATLGVSADLQGVHDGRAGRAVPDHAPEGIPVLIRGAALLLSSGSGGTGNQRRGGGLIHLTVDRGLTLQTLDFFAEGNHIGLHLFIGGVVFSGDHAVFTAMAVQEGLGLVPQVSALFTQSKNLIHSVFLHFFISKATAVSSGLPLSLGCQG